MDIQKNRFVVRVIGWGVGGERWMVDRYNIKWASRDGEVAAVTVAPASRLEDWNLITTDA
ncbi:MAG: phage terminase large subunit family protein [Candidatus Competibacteraceae bacterium]|nr:phage terminase large subunit family protein [Candidatus Competibacteraceae bacterium]